MNIFEFFKLPTTRKNTALSATAAKERLKIVVSHERSQNENPEFLTNLRKELLQVLSKYVKINEEQIQVQLQRAQNHSILELNVAIPNHLSQKTTEMA